MQFDHFRILIEIQQKPGIFTSDLEKKFTHLKGFRVILSRIRKKNFVQLKSELIQVPNFNHKVVLYRNYLTAFGEQEIQKYISLIKSQVGSSAIPSPILSIIHTPHSLQKDQSYLLAIDNEEKRIDLINEWVEFLTIKRFVDLTQCPVEMQDFFYGIAEQIVEKCIKNID